MAAELTAVSSGSSRRQEKDLSYRLSLHSSSPDEAAMGSCSPPAHHPKPSCNSGDLLGQWQRTAEQLMDEDDDEKQYL
jgi:hypothetical protein